MNFKVALQTDIGRRETNQDSCNVQIAETDNGNVLLAIMCDGMGGLSKGELASANMIHVFSDWFQKELPMHLAQSEPITEIRQRWNRIIQQQNQAIGAYGRSVQKQLGTTITVMVVLEDGRYIIGHVGDSRAYKITDNSVMLLTEDQTVVARDVKQGILTPEQAEQDPRRNVLLQCVGASRVVEPAFYEGVAESNTCYMLCSDGFRHVITTQEILSAMSPSNNANEQEMEKNIVELIKLNKIRDERDNITALLIKTD